jgi:hypothetical protein
MPFITRLSRIRVPIIELSGIGIFPAIRGCSPAYGKNFTHLLYGLSSFLQKNRSFESSCCVIFLALAIMHLHISANLGRAQRRRTP